MSERDIGLYSAASHNDEEKGEAEFIMYSEDFLPSTSSRSLTESRRNSIRSNDGILLNRSLRRRRESVTGKSSSTRILHTNKSAESGKKIKILALHGKASNGKVTQLQLANLGILNKDYDIIYLDGPLEEEDGDPEITELVNGPFHSWYYASYSDGRFKSSFYQAILTVMAAIRNLGPFDAVYGFSQGAAVAAFCALLLEDRELREAVESYSKDADSSKMYSLRSSLLGTGAYTTSSQKPLSLRFERNMESSLRSSLKMSFKTAHETLVQCMHEEMNPFNYMILACPVADPSAIRHALGLHEEERKFSITIPSMILIGVDDNQKMKSEEFSYFFSDVQVKYIVGGHSVPRMVSSDKELVRILRRNLKEGRNHVEMQSPIMKKISGITSMGLLSSVQVALVELEESKMCDTLIEALSNTDRNKPLLYNARDTNQLHYTSYGDVLDFIDGGDGDLRRLGVQQGDVVVYGSPPGGAAVSALAFLSIMAQTTAAPLAPNTSESDAYYFLELFNAKHLILFEGVNNPGLDAAFEKYAATGKAVLHKAVIGYDERKPGLFKYTHSGGQRLDTKWLRSSLASLDVFKALVNPPDGVALLLGTSGTTSKPKGVPIRHSNIVRNSFILAASLGLNKDDICYSIMPLFHIGGISASILCSIAAGSSICCDDKTFSPENMIDALALSNPQPTWYSSVPTIHNATVDYIKNMARISQKLQSYGVQDNGVWKEGHALRIIRSGAAELLSRDAISLSSTYGVIPIIPTYSMSEQMPISQPPLGKLDMVFDKPGSVGVPVATSLAIVNSTTLQPLPYGIEGEIAISGPTVIDAYINNRDADRKAFFELTLPLDHSCKAVRNRFFLTGDIGILDKDGFLSLRGRNKELIKKGGEQISPFEIEEALLEHPWVRKSVCFSVPSTLYGEEAGAAIVLSPDAPSGVTENEISKEMRTYLLKRDVNPLKWPTHWKVAKDEELPKTKTNKYIRVGLSQHFNLEEVNEQMNSFLKRKQPNNTFIDWDVISGLRFLLACYVMFMHIGANESWRAFNNLRGWPWHVHVFFTLGGFSLAAPMNPVIENKFKYFVARIGAMYPMYAVALIFVLVNLLVTCRPSTFSSNFHWDAQPDDLYIDGDKEKGLAPLFCEGTPVTPKSYWASLFLTIIIYITGSTITPIFFGNWWMGYYFWFSAMYYQCLMVFPSLYNRLTSWRRCTKMYISILIGLLIFNTVILATTWFVLKDYKGYNHYDELTGNENPIQLRENASKHNAAVLAWYLFSPFWIIYFAIGAVLAFLYDSFRPTEKMRAWYWGYAADTCSLFIIIWSICLISQGDLAKEYDSEYSLRPDEANNYIDTAVTNRLWDSICGRFLAPLTTLWIFALSTGEGWTASVLRSKFLVDIIAPHAYNCFLFHQPVGQWYYAATRNGHWWNWWRYRKTMYWFSPSPVPVEWYEYFYVVILTVGFSALMNITALPLVNAFLNKCAILLGKKSDEEIDTEDSLIKAIEDMSGFTPELDWSLDQCGLSSVGLPQLAQRLQNALSTKHKPISISAASLSSARTVGDIVAVLDEIKIKAKADGV